MFSFAAPLRALVFGTIAALASTAPALAIPVFANGQGVSCETCHTTFPGMTRYGMSVMMTNFQILNEHLQNQALPIAARLYITSLLANGDHKNQTQVSDLSLLGGGFAGRNFTWYGEQHIIDGGTIGQTEQLWLSWNGLLGGTNSLQLGKFHTPFPFMPAHAWSISPYLLAGQSSGQNAFNADDARWGMAFNGMSNEFMYNLSWVTGSGPTGDALDFNKTKNERALDANISYGGMQLPWSVGLVAIRGTSPLADPDTGAFIDSNAFTRQGIYFGYQTNAWHYQTMYYTGNDATPDIGLSNVPLHGFFFEAERDLGWQNHILARYDVASSDTLNRQIVVDLAHNVLPNLAIIGEVAGYPNGGKPAIAFQIAYAGPYTQGKRILKDFTAVPARNSAITTQPVARTTESVAVASPATPSPAPAATIAATPAFDANNGAKLVQANGCAGCHGAGLKGGGIGPALFGIEHKMTNDQIGDFIVHPRAPMPNFGFTAQQAGDIVAYLTTLDGGAASDKPVVTFDPAVPVDQATISVRFPGTPPKDVTVMPTMQMGHSTMQTRLVHLTPSASDPHVFTGKVVFSMGGPWTIDLQYDGKSMTVPLNVGQ